MQPTDPITITLSGATLLSLFTGIGGWFLNTFLSGKGKPPKTACANCPFHADHEKRIIALELHRARMEEALPAIRNTLHDMQETLKTILLRVGGEKNNQ